MERGKVALKDNSKVHQIRARYTQRPIHPSQTDKKGGPSKPTGVPSKFYNNGNCIHEGEHMDGHVLHKHACAYCYKMVKRFCYHSELSCNRKEMKRKKRSVGTGSGISGSQDNYIFLSIFSVLSSANLGFNFL